MDKFKLIITFLLLNSIFVSFVFNQSITPEQAFQKFKKDYNVTYKSTEDEQKNKEIFIKNFLFIEKVNAKVRNQSE